MRVTEGVRSADFVVEIMSDTIRTSVKKRPFRKGFDWGIVSFNIRYKNIGRTDAGGPAADKKVTIWKPGELYVRGTTDSQGRLEVPINLSSPGEMYVTVIGQDYLPDVDTINVYLHSSADDDGIKKISNRLRIAGAGPPRNHQWMFAASICGTAGDTGKIEHGQHIG